MTYEEIERRYPLLIKAMIWAAILSTTEAADCIRAIQEHRGSGEAVQHFGGPVAVFQGALRVRRWARENRKRAACDYCEKIEEMTGRHHCPIHLEKPQPSYYNRTGPDGLFPARS